MLLSMVATNDASGASNSIDRGTRSIESRISDSGTCRPVTSARCLARSKTICGDGVTMGLAMG